MKIEICEQMIQSWLNNIKGCEIVQTNWTISPLKEITKTEIDEIKILMEDIQNKLNNGLLTSETLNALQQSADEDAIDEYNIEVNDSSENNRTKKSTKVKKLNIFKKSKPKQFIYQCEIDVVGVKFNDGIAESIYLVDSAFHKGGLGYHDAVATVVKKIIRAVLVSVIIFGTNVPVNIIFTSPKCNPKLKGEVENVINGLKTIISKDYSNIKIDLYLNELFTQEIYLPLKNKIDQLNNDNDLFMRALNLTSVAESYFTTTTISAPSTLSPTHTSKGTNEKIVFEILNQIIKDGKMSSTLLNDLQIPNFANKTFKISTYPILIKESNFIYSGYEKSRFYKKTITISGDKYLVCSQWIPTRISLLEDWYKTL